MECSVPTKTQGVPNLKDLPERLKLKKKNRSIENETWVPMDDVALLVNCVERSFNKDLVVDSLNDSDFKDVCVKMTNALKGISDPSEANESKYMNTENPLSD